MVLVMKRDGRKERFMPGKIVLDLIRAGVPFRYALSVAQGIERTAWDGITTREIHLQVRCMLLAENPGWMKNGRVTGAPSGRTQDTAGYAAR